MALPEDYACESLESHVGHEFGATEFIPVTQDRINTFADATNDHQWIHVDVERARKHSPFGGTIAHGFLTLSLVAGAMETAAVIPADAKAVFNYGVENLRFLAPVPAGASVRARFTLKSVEAKGEGRKLVRFSGVVDIEGSDKPALVGDFLALVIG